MSKQIVLVVLSILLMGLLAGQTVWQQETVVRESYLLSDVSITCQSPQGELYFLYLEDSYENRTLYLQKFDSAGMALWAEPSIVADGMNIKSQYTILASDDGNYFILWRESIIGQSNTMYLRKIDPNGNPLWQPENTPLDLGNFWGLNYLPDGNGGLNIFYGKSVPDQSYDIWGQHISSDGIPLLPGQGESIASVYHQENPVWCRAASNGTIMLGYSTYVEANYNMHRILNLNPDFSINWGMYIDSGWISPPHVLTRTVLSSDDTEFYITWTETSTSASKLFMQRFDIYGNTGYPQPVLLAHNTANTSLYSSALLTSDNCVMASIHMGSNILPTENYITKVNALGAFVWQQPYTALADSIVGMTALAPDAEGGAFFTLKYQPNANYMNCNTLQHISSTGETLFPGLGVELTPLLTSTYKHSPRISYLNGNIFSTWMNRDGAHEGYYYTVKNSEGTTVGPERRTIVEGIYGNADLVAMQARDNDLVVVWKDSRNNESIYTANQFWYQIVNDDGSLDLERGGALLVDFDTAPTQTKTAYMQDGSTLVLYSCIADSVWQIGGQLIAPDGTLPWGLQGRTFHAFPSLSSISLTDVYSQGNDVYLSWVMNNTTQSSVSRVQKITDGIVQWGESGLPLSSGLPYQITSENLFAFKDGYACMAVTVNTVPQSYYLWVTRLDSNGGLAAGWTEEGVTAGTLSFVPYSTLNLTAAVFQDELLLAYSYTAEDFGRYHYTLLSPVGQVLAQNQILIPDELNQSDLIIDTASGFGFIAKIRQPDSSLAFFSYNWLDGEGIFPWGYQATPINPGNITISSYPALIHGFTDMGYAVTYTDGVKLHCNFINWDGSYLPTFEEEGLSPKALNGHLGTVLDNALYLAWHDQKSQAYTSYGNSEIRMQKLHNINVPLTDDLLPQPQASLTAYPNPFRTLTSLCFDLAKAGKYELCIYNIRGQLVKTTKQEATNSGKQEYAWDGRDSKGTQLGSGIYLVRLKAGKHQVTKKISLIN